MGCEQGLRVGVSEHALKFTVDALRAEGRVDNDQGIGRVFKELFEILAAKVERIFLGG